MPSVVKEAKIAMLDFNLQRHKLQLGVQVVVDDVTEVDKINQREMDITKERIQKILDTGANVVLTTKGIDDVCLKYFVEASAARARARARARFSPSLRTPFLREREGDDRA